MEQKFIVVIISFSSFIIIFIAFIIGILIGDSSSIAEIYKFFFNIIFFIGMVTIVVGVIISWKKMLAELANKNKK